MFKPLSRAGAALGRFLGCRKGICSLEFVIILPLFVLFTFGIIGFSAISYAHNNMVNAAREATRRMAVADGVTCSDAGACAGVTVTCGSIAVIAGTAEDIACGYLADWALTWEVTATSTLIDLDTCDTSVGVMIETSAEAAFIVDFLGFFDASDDLTVDVAMRKELTKRCPDA